MNPIMRIAEIFKLGKEKAESAMVPVSNTEDRKKANYRIVIISLTVMFGLTFIRYFGDAFYFYELLRIFGFRELPAELIASQHSELFRLGWWIFIVTVFYLIIPCLVVKFVFREQLSAFGLTFKGVFKDSWLYAIMLVIMIPVVLISAQGTGFQQKYPYYIFQHGEGLGVGFWTWELMYFFQFFSLEFFFRGFMLHGSKQRFGYYSIFFMCIPYCMIHFTKPLGETIGSIGAGLVLGALSLKSGSVWMGVIIHYSVAILMDMASLWFKGMI